MFFAIKKTAAMNLGPYHMLDMLRYDSARAVARDRIFGLSSGRGRAVEKSNERESLHAQAQKKLTDYHVFHADNVTVARWASFGIRNGAIIEYLDGMPLPKPSKRDPVYHFIINREHFSRFEHESVTGKDPVDMEDLFRLMREDEAVVCSNPPLIKDAQYTQFFLFKAKSVNFAAWRAAGLPIHGATAEHVRISTIAQLPPQQDDETMARLLPLKLT